MRKRFLLRAKDSLVRCLYRAGGKIHAGEKFYPPADPWLIVNALYRTAFGRLADPQGLEHCIRQLQSQVSVESLAEGLVSSAEFQAKHGLSQNVDPEYLRALYRDGLGREPDQAGLANGLIAADKGATRAKILGELASSEEALRGVATLFVTAIYKVAFGRPVDEGGLTNCVRQFLSGVSLEALAVQLVASVEFQARHGSSQEADAEFVKALIVTGLSGKQTKKGSPIG
jgi:Domain of unknown function (DUF4214)